MRRAFTLLELILVMVVIAAAAAFVAPAAGGSRDRRQVESTVRQALALCRLARARAAGEGRTYLLVVEEGALGLARARDPLLAPDDPEDPELEARQEDQGWSRPVDCEEGVLLLAAEVAGVELAPPFAVAFRPDGEADEALLVWGAGREQLGLSIDPRLGQARVVELTE